MSLSRNRKSFMRYLSGDTFLEKSFICEANACTYWVDVLPTEVVLHYLLFFVFILFSQLFMNLCFFGYKLALHSSMILWQSQAPTPLPLLISRFASGKHTTLTTANYCAIIVGFAISPYIYYVFPISIFFL